MAEASATISTPSQAPNTSPSRITFPFTSILPFPHFSSARVPTYSREYRPLIGTGRPVQTFLLVPHTSTLPQGKLCYVFKSTCTHSAGTRPVRFGLPDIQFFLSCRSRFVSVTADGSRSMEGNLRKTDQENNQAPYVLQWPFCSKLQPPSRMEHENTHFYEMFMLLQNNVP